MLCALVMQMEKQGQEANVEDKKEPGEGLEQCFTGTSSVGRKPRKQAVFDQNPQQPSPPLPTQRGVNVLSSQVRPEFLEVSSLCFGDFIGIH